MISKLDNKNALVTAGAQGIGAAITRHLIDQGANVAIHYFSSADTANELVAYAESQGRKAVALSGDLTNEAEATALVQKASEKLGGLNTLINNAGSLVGGKCFATWSRSSGPRSWTST
jgi:3-oxoacyl-[acyl-carrier protein] reductase